MYQNFTRAQRVPQGIELYVVNYYLGNKKVLQGIVDYTDRIVQASEVCEKKNGRRNNL